MIVRKSKVRSVVLLLGLLVCSEVAFAAPSPKPAAEEGYTINFENVSIKEFLKFISRIGNVNVIYNDEELNFNVTIVSEDKTDLQNIMSALVQILRIHGLTLIEEEKNLIIHNNSDVKQIPTVVSEQVPLKGKNMPAIVTKVFKILRGNPAHIASLISPMLSKDALVEVSMGTMQLIITDVASSIQTVQELLMSLDAPETPYDVESYAAKNISVIELATLGKKILGPIVDDTTLELIPQMDTGTLYIVSTPFLIDKTLTVLRELDKQSIVVDIPKTLASENVFIYKLQVKSADDILANLKKIAEEAGSQGFSSTGIAAVIANAKFVKSTKSLMFIGPPQTLSVIESLLKNIDAVTVTSLEIDNSSFYFFEPQGISIEETQKVLKEIAANLKKNDYSRPGLLHTIESARTIGPLGTILFTGSPETLAELKPLLASVQDSVLSIDKVEGPYKFFIYNIKEANEEQMRSSLHNLADYLDANHYPNTELIRSIRTMKWIKATNSLMFTGHQMALKELTDIIPSFDVPRYRSQTPPTQTPLSTDFLLFSPKNMSIEGFKIAIEEMAKSLKSADLADPAFLKTLETVKELPASEQLIFTGDEASLRHLSVVLAEVDQQDATLKEGPYLVHVGKSDYQKIKNALELLIHGLPKTDPLAQMVRGMTYLPEANVVVFRGSEAALQKIQEVMNLAATVESEKRSDSNVIFVPIELLDGKAVVKMLQETGSRLESNKSGNQGLIATLKGAQLNGNFIILSGSLENTAKAKELIEVEEKKIAAAKVVAPSANTAFISVQEKDGKALIKMLQETAEKLEKIPGTAPGLTTTLKDAQLRGNTIILSGSPENVAQAKELIETEEKLLVNGRNIPIATTAFVPIERGDAKTVVKILQETAERLEKIPGSSPELVATLKGAQPRGNVVILSGLPETINQARDLIETTEKNLPSATTAFVPIQKGNAKAIIKSLQETAEKLEKIPGSSAGLIATLKDAQPRGDVIILSGTPETINQTRELIIEEEKTLAVENQVVPTTTAFVPVQEEDAKTVVKILQETAEKLEKVPGTSPGLLATLKGAQPRGNVVILSGTPESINQAKDLINTEEQLLIAERNAPSATTAFIPVQEGDAKTVVRSLQETAEKLEKIPGTSHELIVTLKGAQPKGNIVILSGTPESINQAKELINTEEQLLIAERNAPSATTAFVTVQEEDAKTIVKTLQETAERLEKIPGTSHELIATLKGAQPRGNVVILSGSPETIAQAKGLIDTEQKLLASEKNVPSATTAFIPVQEGDAKSVVKMLQETAEKLEKTPGTSHELIATLKGAQARGNIVILSGSPEAINQAKGLIDTEERALALGKNIPTATTAFVPIQQGEVKDALKMLHDTAERLSKIGGTAPGLITTLREAEGIGNSIILSGTPDNIAQAKELIQSHEAAIASGKKVVQSNTAFIPVPKGEGEQILKMLQDTGKKLERIGGSASGLVTTLQGAELTANGNMIILSGTPANIEKAQELISADAASIPQGANTEVWLYRLKNLSAKDLNASLIGVAKHADEQNPSPTTKKLVAAIESMREIPDSKAVQFVGTAPTLEKLKGMIEILDVQTTTSIKVTDLGGNFLVYKVKHINPQELLNHLKQLVKDEGVNGASETAISKTVKNARYVKESHSLIFTGTKADLEKIEAFLNDIDVSETPQQVATDRRVEGYKLYRPAYVAGPELIQMVKNFEEHLVASGGSNEGLSEVIDHLSYIGRTNAIIVTGDDKSVDEVMNLFKEFDNADAASGDSGPYNESGIETIDETGFLIYKLQHQTGEGIVNALTLISGDLTNMKNQKKNENLIEAIRSVQWIEITNSLIATGEPKILTKLKELIESIDRPLKQVFIEILVIEVSDTTSVDIGLKWGSYGANQNRIGWGLGNYPQTDPGTGFTQNFSEITGSNVPSGGADIPPTNSGFLGVIGDLVWANGNSYASLGSLLTALKNDGDTTVVLSQKIVTQDNQNAKIFSGSNVPFTGSLVTTSGLSQTTNANLEYRNIGVTLSITPIIGDNGIITMDISLENSEEVNQGGSSSSSVSTTTVNGITTTRTSMQTRVHMPDRHFLILSGTMRNQITRAVSGIPCLGGLPMIGAAFSETQKLTVNQNVIVFVKPHIITSSEVYESITRNQREIYGNSKQANVADFNSALELIRSPDDEDDDD